MLIPNALAIKVHATISKLLNCGESYGLVFYILTCPHRSGALLDQYLDIRYWFSIFIFKYAIICVFDEFELGSFDTILEPYLLYLNSKVVVKVESYHFILTVVKNSNSTHVILCTFKSKYIFLYSQKISSMK